MDFGTDIRLQIGGNVLADSKYDFESVQEDDAILQDIINEAMTYEGDLFYDAEYGWSLYDFLHQNFGVENTMLETELKHRIMTKLQRREYVESESIQIETDFENDVCTCLVRFKFVGEDKENRLLLSLDRLKIEVVISDD